MNRFVVILSEAKNPHPFQGDPSLRSRWHVRAWGRWYCTSITISNYAKYI